MEELVADLTRGNATEVKVVLASVVAALALYQVMLMSVGYGKLRPSFLSPASASAAHRAIGGSIVVVTLVVAFMCMSYFGWDEGGVHAVTGAALIAVLVFKVAVVRRWHSLGFLLPWLGLTVLGLFAATWATSAGDFLGVG